MELGEILFLFVFFVDFQPDRKVFEGWDAFQTIETEICYRMKVSRASGTPCGSSYGRFCFLAQFLCVFDCFYAGFRPHDLGDIFLNAISYHNT